jgi:hypothetical protein
VAVDVDIAAFANALAWPITVGTLLVVYRKKIGEINANLSLSTQAPPIDLIIVYYI